MYIYTCRQQLEAKEAECVALHQQIEGLIYRYMCVCVCVCIYIYIYIYMHM